MNQGKSYLVKHLDLSSKTAWCQQADLSYYTKTRDYTDIHVIGGDIVCGDFKDKSFIFFLFLLSSFSALCLCWLITFYSIPIGYRQG